jgi:hypothetical protein
MDSQQLRRAVGECGNGRQQHCDIIAPTQSHFIFCTTTFVVLHKTVRVTPAMEAGIADHVWTIEEMLVKVGAKMIKARFVVGPLETLAAQSKSSAGVCLMQVETKHPTKTELELPLPEECVTFQIALVGSDGLVVGSDRRVSHKSFVAEDSPALQFGLSDKFYESKHGLVVCFYAGGDTARDAAVAIALKCEPKESEAEVEWLTAGDRTKAVMGVTWRQKSRRKSVLQKPRMEIWGRAVPSTLSKRADCRL